MITRIRRYFRSRHMVSIADRLANYTNRWN